ncbi:hypothetical protein PFICI_09992 [Pestalotiopsis fici W106-1]|uniref:Uncharacterized protein n=1 Tax=Pestalotiopsis fici (strain W106-1 / CGMCC3.15140) TaxID=1229662 RepID=W3WVQ3_PESFW|nr:uncharacterized protein PFICI_09992 [Pestalotiopsis fici W106-1]ETS77930.1 hypothetical protein PFICI_09992 [Pestalotiopsis fici W106-1]
MPPRVDTDQPDSPPIWLGCFDVIDVNANEPDNRGRIPLHHVASSAWIESYSPMIPTRSDGLRKCAGELISRTTYIDHRDHNGVTPLHLAAMMSEWLVKELVHAGADPRNPTNDGLTPLHLAVRAREVKIVALLVNMLKEKYPGKFLRYLDARDGCGRTPLMHACISGRPESVSLLLDAGASVYSIYHVDMCVFWSCTEFEYEQSYWLNWWKPSVHDLKLIAAYNLAPDGWDWVAEGGVRLMDRNRPWVSIGNKLLPEFERIRRSSFVDPCPQIGDTTTYDEYKSTTINSVQDTAHLQEIIWMLVTRHRELGTDLSILSSTINNCINMCLEEQHYYTAKCFAYVIKGAAGMLGPLSVGDEFALRRDELGAIQHFGLNPNLQELPDEHVLVHLLVVQDYRLFHKLLLGSYPGLGTPDQPTPAKVCLRFTRCEFHCKLEISVTIKDSEQTTSQTLNFKPRIKKCQKVRPHKQELWLWDEMPAQYRQVSERPDIIEWQYDTSEIFGCPLPVPFAKIPNLHPALHAVSGDRIWLLVRRALRYLLARKDDGRTPENEEEAGALQAALDLTRPYPILQDQEMFVQEAQDMLKWSSEPIDEAEFEAIMDAIDEQNDIYDMSYLS